MKWLMKCLRLVDRLLLLFALIVCMWAWKRCIDSVPPENVENPQNFEIEKAPLFDTVPPLVGESYKGELKHLKYSDGSIRCCYDYINSEGEWVREWVDCDENK